jgi:ferric-dicitrate binding protein FerR (iron transport regulator)
MVLHEVAARWFLREEAGHLSVGEQLRLKAWLEANPMHREAWESVRHAAAVATAGAADPRVMDMRAAALSTTTERN